MGPCRHHKLSLSCTPHSVSWLCRHHESPMSPRAPSMPASSCPEFPGSQGWQLGLSEKQRAGISDPGSQPWPLTQWTKVTGSCCNRNNENMASAFPVASAFSAGFLEVFNQRSGLEALPHQSAPSLVPHCTHSFWQPSPGLPLIPFRAETRVSTSCVSPPQSHVKQVLNDSFNE